MNKSDALKNIAEQASRGDLVFSTNVSASLHIQKELDSPECGLESAAKLIMKEPLMAARVVAIANSVAYSRFGGGVTNIKTAVTILGFSTLRSVIASVAIRQLSQAVATPEIRAQMQLLWQHSAHVGALAHLLARKVSFVDPESALFAGIVHEVGAFYLLSRAEEFPALLSIEVVPNSENAPIETHETLIGRAVLKQLMVPKRVMSAIETLWSGAWATPPVSLGDTLLLANELAKTASPLDPRSPETLQEVSDSIDFPIGTASLKQVLQESSADICSLSNALIH